MDGSDDRGLVIVAIPADNDPVWKISSEKIPHLTLCYLGDQVEAGDIWRMSQFLEHVAKTSMRPFGLHVSRRGTLGDKSADVLFFDTDRGVEKLRDIRSYLLTNREIYNAYHSTEQYEKWLPHLTMGYPETPARPDNREYPGIDWVNFDRIALWTGDYEGPTFDLNRDEVSMSEPVESVLEHFGVKGMKWGVHNANNDAGSYGTTRADKKWAKKAAKFKTFSKSFNAASDRMNKTEISRINNKPQYKNADFTKDSPLRRKYYKEFNDTFEKVINEEALRIMGTNPSGTKRLTYHATEDGQIQFHFDDVKHADGDAIFVARTDSRGLIVGVDLQEDDSMEQSDLFIDAFLEHFGVKGMHWGIIRDKKLLEEARDRTRDAVNRKEHDHKDKSAVREFRKRADKQGVRTLGDKELKQLVARAELEAKYKKLRQEEKEASRAFLKAMWDGFGKELLSAVIREGVAYKFRNMGNKNSGPSRATVIDGRVLDGATKSIGRFATGK